MNIQQLQKLVDTDSWAMSPAIKQRIMDNKMTIRDVNFIEKSIMSMRLYQIRSNMELLVPTFQEASMRLMEMKQQGETEVDIDYANKLVSDLADWSMELKDLVDDFGLTEVEIAWEEETK